MYAIIDMSYGGYDDDSYPVGVKLYYGINNSKEYSDLCNEYIKILEVTENTRKTRKIRKSLANSQALMKELGYPTNWDEFMNSKGIRHEDIEFDTN